jgi:hypothetical protein
MFHGFYRLKMARARGRECDLAEEFSMKRNTNADRSYEAEAIGAIKYTT